MAIGSKVWILGIGAVVTVGGAIWFFAAGGDFGRENARQIGLLVLQVGIGILVVEGVIGSALERDTRARAGSSLAELVAFADAFEPKALRFVEELGAADAEEGGPLAHATFAERFPFPGTYDRDALVQFNAWLDERVRHAIEECRAAAPLLKREEMERIRAPLRLLAPIQSTLKELAQPSRQRIADRWGAVMVALDGIAGTLEEVRQRSLPFVAHS